MPAKSIDNQILQYLPLLEKDQKQSILNVIKSFLRHKDEHSPERISIDQYNKELDEAEARIDSGDFYTHEEVVEMSKKW